MDGVSPLRIHSIFIRLKRMEVSLSTAFTTRPKWPTFTQSRNRKDSISTPTRDIYGLFRPVSALEQVCSMFFIAFYTASNATLSQFGLRFISVFGCLRNEVWSLFVVSQSFEYLLLVTISNLLETQLFDL
jgi:hypothetical protein